MSKQKNNINRSKGHKKKNMSEFYKNESCQLDTVQQVEKEINKHFPEKYIDFLLYSNGGEGRIENNYIIFWKCEHIIQLNKDYRIQHYLTENIIGFAADGDIGYMFDYRYENDIHIVKCSLGDLDLNELIDVTNSFKFPI